MPSVAKAVVAGRIR